MMTGVAQWSQEVIQENGVPDLVINNAGLVNEPAPLWEVPVDECRAVIDVNINGTINVIRHFLPSMLQKASRHHHQLQLRLGGVPPRLE